MKNLLSLPPLSLAFGSFKNSAFSKLSVSLLSGLLLLNGCATVPEKLQVSDNVPLVVFADVRAEPNLNVGLDARWGGVIAKVENQKERTMIEIVRFPLKKNMRPIVGTETEGRFRIYYQGLLDPVIYEEGKSITVLGTIANSEAGVIGEQEYLYPVLNTEKVYLWKEKNNNNNLLYDPYWYSPYYWNYYPSYSHGYYGYGGYGGGIGINHSTGGGGSGATSHAQSGHKK
jgi:outer membrane lipoprotein